MDLLKRAKEIVSNPINKLMLFGLALMAMFGAKQEVEAYFRGQLVGLQAIFVLGAAIILGAVFYVIGDQTLKLNNLQNVGLFPVGLLLISILPVLIAVLAVFRP